MGTDTVRVHPTIVPVEAICRGLTSKMLVDASVQNSQIIDERDDCDVPMEDRISPMRGTIGGCHGSGHTRLREHEWVLTLTVCALQLFLSKESAFFAR